ncbi:MAG TPA: SPOR domain-containing protein [Bauldia sp.]|nr:SPOR domain-containing protein [Bauldia sp.]
MSRRGTAPEPAVEPPADDEFDLSDLAGEAEGPFEDEFTLDDLDAAAYADDEFPPFPEDELASLKRRRSGRVMAVVAAMLAIVVVGGAAVFLFRSDSATGSPPPIIAADAGPTKVPPDEPTTTETDAQGKLIYDRVDDSSDGSDTRLVTSGQAQVGDVPSEDTEIADNPISRVIIPGGPGVDPPASEDGTDGQAVIAEAGAPEPPEGEQSGIGPRMVRTVVVKPDGTIVSSEATGVDEEGNALPAENRTEVASAPEAVPETRTQMDAVLEGGDLPVNPDPLGQPEPREEPATAAAPAEPEPIPEPPGESQVAAAEVPDLPSPQPEASAPAAVTPEPVAPPPAEPQTIVATTGEADGPIDLTPGTAPAAGAAREGGGAVLVQVSAQRSEEAAISAYRGLQQRYPNILGSFQPRIVRADLGERGIYYRVRIGPFSSGDATRLCEDLKAAGGDCLLAR